MNPRERIMNWVWDGWPARKPWWLERVVARVTCRIWGHEPRPDLCGWCLKTTGARR